MSGEPTNGKQAFQAYAGTGKTIGERDIDRPMFRRAESLHDPAGYLAEPGLRDAVNVAVTLGQPLLLTGEPGTGKTELAYSVAHELDMGEPLECHIKTSSTARELFYRYDSLAHFHDAGFRGEGPAPDIERYITYEGLGLAILLAMDPAEADPFLPAKYRDVRRPTRSVVLIDEIDKAPRDLPNDVLNEIEHMEYTVKETGRTFAAKDVSYQPIVILTSNSERTLPDAFLRRCVFYHLTFPDRNRLRAIVAKRLGAAGEGVERILDRFEKVRDLPQLKKQPATAELLGWIRILQELDIDLGDPKEGDREALKSTYSLLAKTREDLRLLQEHEFAGS